MGRPTSQGQGRRPAGQVEGADDGVEDAALLAQVVPSFGRLGQHSQVQGRQTSPDHGGQDEDQAAQHGGGRADHQHFEEAFLYFLEAFAFRLFISLIHSAQTARAPAARRC